MPLNIKKIIGYDCQGTNKEYLAMIPNFFFRFLKLLVKFIRYIEYLSKCPHIENKPKKNIEFVLFWAAKKSVFWSYSCSKDNKKINLGHWIFSNASIQHLLISLLNGFAKTHNLSISKKSMRSATIKFLTKLSSKSSWNSNCINSFSKICIPDSKIWVFCQKPNKENYV